MKKCNKLKKKNSRLNLLRKSLIKNFYGEGNILKTFRSNATGIFDE